jgi:hypothetical protein
VRFKSYSNACSPNFCCPLNFVDPCHMRDKGLSNSVSDRSRRKRGPSVPTGSYSAPAENVHIQSSWLSPCLIQNSIRSVTCSSPFQTGRTTDGALVASTEATFEKFYCRTQAGSLQVDGIHIRAVHPLFSTADWSLPCLQSFIITTFFISNRTFLR